MTTPEGSMLEDLRRWAVRLAKEEITANDMVAAIGEAQDGGSTTQVRVRPHSADWAEAEVIQRSEEEGPDHIRLRPATEGALTATDLDHAFGQPETTPPRVHFDDPERRIYRIDSGEPNYTAALIAEMPAEGGDAVQAVVLRRDARLD